MELPKDNFVFYIYNFYYDQKPHTKTMYLKKHFLHGNYQSSIGINLFFFYITIVDMSRTHWPEIILNFQRLSIYCIIYYE